MELTYEYIANENFISALKPILERDLDIPTMLDLADTIEVIESELKKFNEIKNALIKNYGKEIVDKDGNVTGYSMQDSTPENIQIFNDKFIELIKTTFEVPLTAKVVLKKDSNVKGKIKDYLALKQLVEYK